MARQRTRSTGSRDERGAAAVEFALLTIPFVVLVLGIIQYGFYFYTAETTNSAAREGARRVVVGDCWNLSEMQGFIENQAPRTTSATRSADPATLSVGQAITITVVNDADIMGFLPLPGGGVVTREYAARMEVDEQSDAADDLCAGY